MESRSQVWRKPPARPTRREPDRRRSRRCGHGLRRRPRRVRAPLSPPRAEGDQPGAVAARPGRGGGCGAGRLHSGVAEAGYVCRAVGLHHLAAPGGGQPDAPAAPDRGPRAAAAHRGRRAARGARRAVGAARSPGGDRGRRGPAPRRRTRGVRPARHGRLQARGDRADAGRRSRHLAVAAPPGADAAPGAARQLRDPNMSDQFTEQLSAYLDGELDARARARLEAHLDGCADCAAVLADLRAIVAAAPEYVGREPSTDLWPGIEARLVGDARTQGRKDATPGGDDLMSVHSSPPPPVRLSARPPVRRFSLPQLLAASITMAILGGGTVWLALGDRGSAPAGTRRIAVAPPVDTAIHRPAHRATVPPPARPP